MQIIEIIDAVSISACGPAVEIQHNGQTVLECETFQALFEDWEPSPTAGKWLLVKTSRVITVRHKYKQEGMVPGQHITVERYADGGFGTVVWPCEGM